MPNSSLEFPQRCPLSGSVYKPRLCLPVRKHRVVFFFIVYLIALLSEFCFHSSFLLFYSCKLPSIAPWRNGWQINLRNKLINPVRYVPLSPPPFISIRNSEQLLVIPWSWVHFKAYYCVNAVFCHSSHSNKYVSLMAVET